MNHQSIIVLGTGTIGLTVAYHLGENALIIDQNNRFHGWGHLIEQSGFSKFLRGKLQLDTCVTQINPTAQTVILQDGTEVLYDYLISAIELPHLLRLLPGNVPLIDEALWLHATDGRSALRTALIKHNIVLAEVADSLNRRSFEEDVAIGLEAATLVQQLQAEQGVVS